MFFLLSFFSCQSEKAPVKNKAYQFVLNSLYKKTVPFITISELDKKMQTDTGQMSYVLLDTRPQNEFQVSHIPNAIRVGFEDFEPAGIDRFPKNTDIVVYCSVGYRSERIGEQLQTLGFSKVKNLYGGIFEWANQGKILHNNEGQETNKVHAYNKKWAIWLNKGEKVFD